MIAPGSDVGRYRLESKLGAGGMGEVWRAADAELGRPVALKFLRGDDPDEVARFKREAQIAAQLAHPNIAAIYEVGDAGGRPFIAMQCVDGRTLSHAARGDVRLAVRLVRDAALAVQYAHQQGVIHRDLKPSNIMVEGGPADPRVYVMDFGLAKRVSREQSLTTSGMLMGTPAYMAPEQARGESRRITARSDVYSLGATLYELVAGRPPFDGRDVIDLLVKVVQEDPTPLARVDRDLGTIIMKCLEKEPARRYASARDLADDLTRWLAGEAIAAHAPFTQALRYRPKEERALLLRGRVKQDVGDPRGAIEDYTALLGMNPGLVEAYNGRARARSAIGELDAALADHDTSIHLDPRSAHSRTKRGLTRAQKGDFDGAIADHDEAIRLDPRSAQSCANRADGRRQRGDLRAALEDIDRAVELDARTALYYGVRAMVREGLDDRAGAVADARQAIRLGLSPGKQRVMESLVHRLGGKR